MITPTDHRERLQGLGVIGRRVDHLHTQVDEALLKHEFGAVESPGETQAVVEEHLAGQPIPRSSHFEGVPGQLPGGSRPSKRSQQITGMVVDQINHSCVGPAFNWDPGGVNLPQVVGDLPFEPFVDSRAPWRLGSDQTVANQHLMDRGHRRRINPGTDQFADPPSTAGGDDPYASHRSVARVQRGSGSPVEAVAATDPPIRPGLQPGIDVDTGNRSDARSHTGQGITTGHTFTVITGGTDRRWAYVAMSRGRQANTFCLANPRTHDEQCAHLTHPDRRKAVDALTASLGRNSSQTAAIDHIGESPPPSSHIAERVAWIVARRRAEHDQSERTPPDIELAAE